MNISRQLTRSALAKTALAGAMALALPWAAAMPVNVGVSTTGSAGDWALDFTVANNIVHPEEAQVFLFAVDFAGTADMVGAPFTFLPAGLISAVPSDGNPPADYAFGWFDIGLDSDDGPHLDPGTSFNGFTLHTDSLTLPGSISWIVAAYAGEDDHSDDDGHDGLGYVTYQGVITTGVSAVPEPSTYALMLLGVAALGLRRERRIKGRG